MSSLAVVHDGNLSKNVDLVSCCPNMDLIALSMSDGTLAVNRWSFVWQQVFSSKKETTSSSRSTSLCWSPRGHVLAVGREDGTIDFYNCESVGKIRTLKAHDCAVTTMSWVVQNDRSDGYPDNTSSYIQRPPNLPKPKSFANFNTVPDSNEYKSDEKFPNRMDVLFSGTERGDFAAHAFGEFPCARLVLESDSVVKNIRVSNDLCIVNVLMENKDGEYDCVTLDSTFLWTYRRSIRVLAGHACEIEKMIDHVSKTFLEMRKNWQSGIRPLKDFLEAMSSTLIKYGRCDSPKEELLSLIASGPSDAALQLFGMPEHVTSHILKRMHKSCVGACESLISMIAKYLRPALEVCAFRANDMRGLALCEDDFERIGWTSELADKLVSSIDSCLIKSQSLDLAVREARDDFDSLLIWLRDEWQRYQGAELENSSKEGEIPQSRKKKSRVRLDPRCRDRLIRMLRRTIGSDGDKNTDTNYLLHDDVNAHLEDARNSLPSYSCSSSSSKTQMSDCEIGILQDVENLFQTSFGSKFSNATFGYVFRDLQKCWNQVGGLPSSSLRCSVLKVDKISFRVKESKSVNRWCGIPSLHYYEELDTFVLLLPFEMCSGEIRVVLLFSKKCDDGLKWFKSTSTLETSTNKLMSDFYGSKTGLPSSNPERLVILCTFENGGGEINVIDHVSILSNIDEKSLFELSRRDGEQSNFVENLCNTIDLEFEIEKKHVIEKRNIAGLCTCGPRGILCIASSNPCFFTLIDVEEEEEEEEDEMDEEDE